MVLNPESVKDSSIKRSKDIQMAATICPENRIIMVSGAIDQNETTIVLRVPVPEPGIWTVIKAEVNLTNESWTIWQIDLGEGISLPSENPAGLLLSRQFKKCKYMPERHAIMFYDGEVRPGDAIFKIARLDIKQHKDLGMSHNRATLELNSPKYSQVVESGFGEDYPKIEVIAPVRIVEPGDTDIQSFMQNKL